MDGPFHIQGLSDDNTNGRGIDNRTKHKSVVKTFYLMKTLDVLCYPENYHQHLVFA